ETGFRIERCVGSGCSSFAALTTVAANVTTLSDSAVTASTTYRYRVQAFNAVGNSSWSNIVEQATPAPPPVPPAAPSGLTSSPVSPTQINQSWTDNSSDESGFRIERCIGSGCSSFAALTTVAANVTTLSDSGLTASTTYRYRVQAFNVVGNSSWSNIVEQATPAPPPVPPAAPSGLTSSPVSPTQINLSWT